MNPREFSVLDADWPLHATRHRAPPGLSLRVQSALRAAEGPRRHSSWPQAFALAASFVVVSVVSWHGALVASAPQEEVLARDVTTAHIRSLLAEHLNDVISTDQHTVKPWLARKLDFAPPVRDFASVGLKLTGGRLDYLDGREVAALTYAYGGHVVNLFVWPSRSERETAARPLTREGYAMLQWTSGGMNYWAISDMGAAELATLARTMRQSP